MSATSPKAMRARQSRKSIAHVPSITMGGHKENATMDSAALSSIAAQSKEQMKKTRSKSIGPGGLDALKEGSGNKGEPVPRPSIKSILKSTVLRSPQKTSPERRSPRNSFPGRSARNLSNKSPQRSPSRRITEKGTPSLRNASPRKNASPDRSPSRMALRTEEEQQEAAREREQQEKLSQKEARRKSLASRRVSFAPEATLHTWNVVELPEDSTTSSASTNSTRRASALTASAGSPYTGPQPPLPSSDASEPPSTPPEQAEELQVAASPAHQRDLHQKKRRRSSTVPPLSENDTRDLSSSPASITSEDSGSQTFDPVDEHIDSSDSDDKDLEDEETVTGIDGDDSTIQSAAGNSTTSSGRLEAALQQAARQAGTQGIDFDENGDISMEMADDEVTNAFKPWMTKGSQLNRKLGDGSAHQDQENADPFSSVPRPTLHERQDEEGDGTMEMTTAIGSILPKSQQGQTSPKRSKRKSIVGRRRSSIARRRSSEDVSTMAEDETMDLTLAVGGIQQDSERQGNDLSDSEDEELSMEFTSVIGGVVQPVKSERSANLGLDQSESSDTTINGEDMDMTFAGGGILPSITETTEPIEDQIMDVTTATGNILSKQLNSVNKPEAKALMELEADVGQLSASPFHDGLPQKPMGAGLTDVRPLPALMHKAAMASETGSPSLAPPQSSSAPRKSIGRRQSMTPQGFEKQPTPIKKPGTPSKQATPQADRPTTPGKTPPSKNITLRTASPKRLFKAEIKAAARDEAAPASKLDVQNPFFKRDSFTGTTTPSIILKPHKRRSSGVGADREGLGSPRVSELLDRRGSIGENASRFVPQGQSVAGVRFENPRVMSQEVDQERREEERRESGRTFLQDEADQQDLGEAKDATTDLKDMIESLTPQKRTKLNGRKSLAVGGAKGLLGKRPAELDEDDEDEDATKRLKGREGSPVKKIKLPAPPPKSATTGRVTRSNRKSLLEVDANVRTSTPTGPLSPFKNNTTPKGQPRFKDAERQSPEKVQSFEQKLEHPSKTVEVLEDEGRIYLQEFLNMTSIRFIELTTTKRRHTVAPNTAGDQSAKKPPTKDESLEENEIKNDLESRVVAGICTVPMLELYQHSCRELKNYISEGRSIVKEIEADTYEENPPLFREYMAAPAGIKPIMDNQFKNVKTHARHLSKAMWYEWRMKLLEGLREGLLKIGEDLEQDRLCLTQQEQMIQPVLPDLIEQHERLENEAQTAQAQADELADCDQEELKYVRETLTEIEDDLEAKERMVEELQAQLKENEDRLETTVSQKERHLEDIKEAEKLLQSCRGWSSTEVAQLQANVDALESSTGWTITSANGPAIAMTYGHALQLFFTPSCFLPNKTSSQTSPRHVALDPQSISLTYITPSSSQPQQTRDLTTEKRFFLQIIRATLQSLPQSQTRIADLLSFVARSWDVASAVAEELRMLAVTYITDVCITSDEAMAVKAFVLLPNMRTKVEVVFEIRARPYAQGDGGTRSGDGEHESRSVPVPPVTVVVSPSTKVWYGEALKEGKMGEFLESKIKGHVFGQERSVGSKGVLVRATRELEERCLARGKR